MSMWISPYSTHEIDTESTTGTDGVPGQKYLIWPQHGGVGTSAGVGISAGTNGVSVYEHTDGYMPPLLVWNANVEGWTHVTVVYTDKTPKLYINGALARTGLTSTMNLVFPGPGNTADGGIGGGVYGFFNGSVDDVQIYSRALNLSEVRSIYNASQYQYFNNFSGLNDGSHNFTSFAQDAAGNVNFTDNRTVQISTSTNTLPNVSSIRIESENGTALLKSLNVNCTFNITDANAGDTLSANWSFWKNNATNLANGTLSGVTNGANTTVQLMKANITRGDSWKCSIIPFDGTTNGSTLNSSEIIVQNSLPTTYLLLLNAGNISTNRYPNFTWITEDADNGTDSFTYTFNLSCYAGCSGDNKLLSGLTQTNYSVAPYLRYLQDENYYYNWSVKTNDSIAESAWASTRKFEVQSLVAFSIVNDTLLFGSLNPNDRKNTTDGSIGPFNITNDGNVFLNITLNATNIWERTANPTVNYQYKVANSTSEPGAFAWGKSNTSWAYIPSISGMAVVGYLNWTNEGDMASLDIHLTVPSDEPAGAKTSTINFEASYADEWGR